MKNDPFWWLPMVLIILMFTGLLGLSYARHNDREFIQGTVQEKYIKKTGNNSSDKYMFIVITDQGQQVILENTDSIWENKFNSADYYAQIRAGERYRFEVYGWRSPFMSWFPNIVAAERLWP